MTDHKPNQSISRKRMDGMSKDAKPNDTHKIYCYSWEKHNIKQSGQPLHLYPREHQPAVKYHDVSPIILIHVGSCGYVRMEKCWDFG